jgi:hypothetical protein
MLPVTSLASSRTYRALGRELAEFSGGMQRPGDDPGAVAGQGTRHRQADPPARTGDDGCLPAEVNGQHDSSVR